MPTYEMPILFRVMTRPELVTTLKRVSGVIFSKGGFIRQIDNLGQMPTPYKTRAHGHFHRDASYFIIHFDAPPRSLDAMTEEYSRDVDILKTKMYKMEKEPSIPCTLHDELLPPPYRSIVVDKIPMEKFCYYTHDNLREKHDMRCVGLRPEVIKLVEIANRQLRNKYQFKSKSGLKHYPFQR